MKFWKTDALPPNLTEIESKTQELGFNMASDRKLGSILRTLVASRQGGRILELGTGTGHALAWMLDGMDAAATLITLDNDPATQAVAEHFYSKDVRVRFQCADAGQWLSDFKGEPFDLVFADAWPGKFSHLDQALSLIRPGGIYFIDDLIEQPNWPVGHHAKVRRLIRDLESRKNFVTVKMDWSTGILIAVRRF